jgi:hypothetical protein
MCRAIHAWFRVTLTGAPFLLHQAQVDTDKRFYEKWFLSWATEYVFECINDGKVGRIQETTKIS